MMGRINQQTCCCCYCERRRKMLAVTVVNSISTGKSSSVDSTIRFIVALLALAEQPLMASGGGGGGDSGSTAEVLVGLPMGPELRMEPYFAEEDWQPQQLSRNVTAQAGETVFLECRIRNLGAKRISWVRHRDVHILSVGSSTFTSDRRFSSKLLEDEGRFILTIRGVQERDAGGYECQVSTKPTKTFLINLHVEVPSTQILGESAIHVERNSALSLTCVVSGLQQQQQQQQQALYWYKDGKLLDSSVGGRGVISPSSGNGTAIFSLLGIDNAEVNDSGNYTCKAASNASKSSVKVHVLVDGESPNAWKTNAAVSASLYRRSLAAAAATTLLLLLFWRLR